VPANALIPCAIGVRMTSKLKKHIARLSDHQWKPYREDAEAVSECADLLNDWPEEEDRPEGAGPLRYVVIRVRRRQGVLPCGRLSANAAWLRRALLTHSKTSAICTFAPRA
jgi:hypothetical protein